MALSAKRRALLCVLLAAFVLIWAAWYLCAGSRVTAWSSQQREKLAEEMDAYALNCVMHEEDSTLAVTQEITFTNRTGQTLDELVLRTYANAFETEDYSPAAIEELYDQTYGDAFSPGGITLQGIWWQGEMVSHAFDDDAGTVLRINTGEIAPGETGMLRMMYVFSVPECAYRFGRTESIWQLGNAFPILSVWEGGAWRTDEYYPIGDPFISESASWQLTLTMPDDYTLAASAPMEKGKDGIWRGEILCARDFAMALVKGGTVKEKAFGDVRVQVVTRGTDGKNALDEAGKILEVLCGLYGDYPYDTLTIAQVSFPFGGMEYPGLIFVEDSYLTAEDDSLELLLAHEIAHQWFYALAGSDNFANPWQDEALAQWAALRYVGVRYGADAEDRLKYYYVDAPMEENVVSSVTPGSPVDYFGDYMTYDSVVYGRGTALLYAIDAFTGGKADVFLRDYAQNAAFGLRKRADFEKALSSFTGEDLSPLLTDYLDTLMD